MGRAAAGAEPQSFDRLAADYDRYTSLEPPLILDWLLPQLPDHGRRALDAGCGSGAMPWPWPTASTWSWASTAASR
jgi:ubiquinone/menaquinone biosynthesis C-methylase UbiE